MIVLDANFEHTDINGLRYILNIMDILVNKYTAALLTTDIRKTLHRQLQVADLSCMTTNEL